MIDNKESWICARTRCNQEILLRDCLIKNNILYLSLIHISFKKLPLVQYRFKLKPFANSSAVIKKILRLLAYATAKRCTKHCLQTKNVLRLTIWVISIACLLIIVRSTTINTFLKATMLACLSPSLTQTIPNASRLKKPRLKSHRSNTFKTSLVGLVTLPNNFRQ